MTFEETRLKDSAVHSVLAPVATHETFEVFVLIEEMHVHASRISTMGRKMLGHPNVLSSTWRRMRTTTTEETHVSFPDASHPTKNDETNLPKAEQVVNANDVESNCPWLAYSRVSRD